MNESDFEKELRKLRPAPPSDALGESIAQQLSSPAALTVVERNLAVHKPQEKTAGLLVRLFPKLGWACAGAAAALTVIALLPKDNGQTRQPESAAPGVTAIPDFEPETITRAWVAAEDGGLIYEDDQEPARIVRYSTLERHAWTNAATGARLEVEVPRQDVFLLPVAMQ